MKKLIALLAILLLTLCTSDKITGTTDEQLTVKAMISNPDGSAAVGATVKLFKVDDSLKTPAFTTVTDTDGQYAVSGVTQGTYNIWAEKDTLVAFQDSIILANTDTRIPDDTIYPAGSFTAVVGMQPNDDPRGVIVQILGSDLYDDNVQADGHFTIKGIASGSYRLRLTTTLPNYATTFSSITAHGGQHDTLQDTIWMIYTGIPVVNGLTTSYDTLNGTVKISWRKTVYKNFQDYLVYRDAYNAIQLSTDAIASVSDTFLIDTIFKPNSAEELHSFSDTNTYKYKYRVLIRNNSNVLGQPYGFTTVMAIPPKLVQVTFNNTFRHIAKGLVTDSASISDSILVKVLATNVTRPIVKIVWKNLDSATTIKTTTYPDSLKIRSDSIVYFWPTIGQKRLAYVAFDAAGTEWVDTIRVTVVNDAPVITVADTAQFPLSTPGTIKPIVTDRFGSIVKYEWDIGSTGAFVTTQTAESPSIKVDSLGTELKAVLRVTDDDGALSVKTMNIIVILEWEKIAGKFIGIGETFVQVVQMNQKIIVFTTISSNPNPFIAYVYASTNGSLWNKEPLIASDSITGMDSRMILFHDTLWNIFRTKSSKPICFSVNGTEWKSTSLFEGNYNYFFDKLGNNLYVYGSSDPSPSFSSRILSSGDGITWVNAGAIFKNIDLSAPRFVGNFFEFNNRFWGIGDEMASACRIYSSDNIETFSETASPFFQKASKEGLGDTRIRFVAVYGNKIIISAYNTLFYSSNGINWVECSNFSQITQEKFFGEERICLLNDTMFYIDENGVWATK
jgi:hypothetical protein